MLPVDKLYMLINQAETENYFKQLQEIYNKLPDTSCEQCGTCCTVPQPAFLMEYLNIYRFLKNNLQEQLPEILKKAARYYFLELGDINIKCPFLDEENKCAIYPVRPYNCRTFGVLPEKDTVFGTEGQMATLAQKFRSEHDIRLPEEIVNFKLSPCYKVELLNNKKVTRQKLGEYLAEVSKFDGLLLPPEIVEKNLTFIPAAVHLAHTVLSEGARVRKMKVLKEYIDTGKSEALDKYIDDAASFNL
jgi:Fe-S-cluster containining protein